jgi:hypothetical protein
VPVLKKYPGAWEKAFQTRGSMVGRDLMQTGIRVGYTARALVGQDTGRLKKTIRPAYAGREAPSMDPSVEVRSGGRTAPYALYHHEGTRGGYTIRPRNKRALAFPVKGGRIVVTSEVRRRRGNKANPYLRAALEMVVRDKYTKVRGRASSRD